MNLKSHRWPALARSAALTAVAAAVLGLSSSPVWALSLGPVVVQSALGEPLRAEIDILDINAEEAASLKTSVASPEAFRAAGLDYNAAMSGLRVNVARRSNGRAYISLQSDKPVNDPFVDMILETSWASGRIVRDYTLLFDPPNLRGAPVAVAQAALPMAVPTPAVVATPSPSAQRGSGGSRPAPRAAAVAAPKAAATQQPGPQAGQGQVTVKQGDTASKIAMATKPANISLDQMLVALMRANPDAFIQGNLNRLKSGAVLTVPTAEQAGSTGAKEASQTVIAQSRDFGDFRKKLATAAPSAQVAAASRESAGSVQAKVEDKKPSATAPDKLTLSKGAVAAQANAEKIAKDLAAKDAASKSAEVSKNIAELAKIGAASAPLAPTSPAAAGGPAPAGASTPAAASTTPNQAPALVAAAPAAPASVAAAAAPSAPAASAAAAKPVVAAKPAVKVPAPPPEPTLVDQLTENPMVPAAGAGLVALLAGFGWYRARQRKKANEVDSAFLESRLQPDSFFGSSGGQRVDTNETGAGSSMVYTPSQLDAADDVDPVAEADVYLAYGRDVQAEEILREALKTNAGRIAIHQKLLEIYSKRRDTRSFELTASEAYRVTNGEGADWTRICDQGLAIDPSNPLYMPGGKPAVAVGIPSQPMPLDMQQALAQTTPIAAQVAAAPSGAAAATAAMGAAAVGMATVSMTGNNFSATTAPLAAQAAEPGSVDLDFDLDLDFSLDEDNAKVISDMGTASQQTSKMAAVDSGSVPLDMDFNLPTGPVTEILPPQATNTQPLTLDTKPGVIEFDMPMDMELSRSGEVSRPAPLESSSTDPAPLEMDEFKKEAAVSFGTTVAGPLANFAAKAPPAPAPEALNFDLGSLSLDLGDGPAAAPAASAAVAAVADADDPLATKLALAEEFSSIGDADGARSMIEEVIAEATGDVKARAQQALARLA